MLHLLLVSLWPLYFLFCRHARVCYVTYMTILLCCFQDGRSRQREGKYSDLLCSCPSVTRTNFRTSEHLIYDPGLFMGNLFVIPHFYLVECIKHLNVSHSSLPRSLSGSLSFSLIICHPPRTLWNQCKEDFHQSSRTMAHKMWHLQHRYDNETASQWSWHKSRAVTKLMCCCLIGNCSLWPSWKHFT